MIKGTLYGAIRRIIQFFNTKNTDEQNVAEDYSRMKEMLERRSTLEEIGLLTASIEHDIKNPLAVMESEIQRMKRKFQANPEVIAGLERIDEQKQRVYA